MATENLSRIASDFETQLSGAIAVGATSFVLQSIIDLDGNDLSDGVYCFTIDRDSTSSKEYLVGQLTASTKTVASISSVGRQGVLTANAQRAHRIGANVIISDHSILAAVSRIFTGQGTINPAAPLSYTTAPTLSAATDLATKGYVDSVVTGGTVNTDRIILGSQTAGETVAAGEIVYFKSSDSRWWLADADLTATFTNVQLGVAQGAGSAGEAISGGVLIYGKCDSFTGLTATATYYLSNTAGAVATSAGTTSVIVGQAFDTTGIFFNPDTIMGIAIDATTGSSDAGKIIKTNAQGVADTTLTKNGFKTNAGETINGETLPVPIYINTTDNEVYACDANDSAKYNFIGFAITNSTDGNPITVQTSGIVTGFTGLSEGEVYYISDTAGAISATAGTQIIKIGTAVSETSLLIQRTPMTAQGFSTIVDGTDEQVTEVVITTGFRPRKITVYSRSSDTDGVPQSECIGVWTNGSSQCMTQDPYGGPVTSGSYILYLDIGDPDWIGFISAITNTSFTLYVQQKASIVDTLYYHWVAEE